MAATDDEFNRERDRAIEELERDEVMSFYLGMILDEDDGQAIEYRLRTDDDDPQLRSNVNLIQVSMLLSVIADEANASLEEVAQASVERAKAENLPQQV
jgi:hypothetical protein